MQSYQVLEGNGPAQPVLRLSHVVDCCSTISVWVQVEEIDATRKYLCDLLCLRYFVSSCKYTSVVIKQSRDLCTMYPCYIMAGHISIFVL